MYYKTWPRGENPRLHSPAPLYPLSAAFMPRKTEDTGSRAVSKCDPQIIDEKEAILNWCLFGSQENVKDDSCPKRHTSTGLVSISFRMRESHVLSPSVVKAFLRRGFGNSEVQNTLL